MQVQPERSFGNFGTLEIVAFLVNTFCVRHKSPKKLMTILLYISNGIQEAKTGPRNEHKINDEVK